MFLFLYLLSESIMVDIYCLKIKESAVYSKLVILIRLTPKTEPIAFSTPKIL